VLKRLRGWLLGADAARLEAEAGELRRQNAALAHALGQAHARAEAEENQKVVILGALAMRAGGDMALPMAFVETLAAGDYRLVIRPSEDSSVLHIIVEES
jgi:hypothetical protein